MLTFPMFTLIICCVVTEGLSQLCFKHASGAPTIARTLARPVLWLGIFLWFAELVAWTNVLEHVPLSIAFPLMSLTYVTTLLAGAAVFRERVNKRHIIGALLVTIGVACVGVTGI